MDKRAIIKSAHTYLKDFSSMAQTVNLRLKPTFTVMVLTVYLNNKKLLYINNHRRNGPADPPIPIHKTVRKAFHVNRPIKVT